jgi:hypothetical protein
MKIAIGVVLGLVPGVSGTGLLGWRAFSSWSQNELELELLKDNTLLTYAEAGNLGMVRDALLHDVQCQRDILEWSLGQPFWIENELSTSLLRDTGVHAGKCRLELD